MYEYFNPNPLQRFIDDCAPRALVKALGIDWETAMMTLCNTAIQMASMPDDKQVFMAVLRGSGFEREAIPNTCPDCYTAEDFANEHFKGTYVLCFGNHVVACIDGILYDTADCRTFVPHFYWHKKEAEE